MIQQIYPSVPHSFQYELNKDFHFSAAHYVPNEDVGECSRMHGHTYFINITIAGNDLDGNGFLANFSHMKKLIHQRFDHSLINEHTTLFNDGDPQRYPTTENIARTIFELVQAFLDETANKPRCLQIFLRETPTSYVIFRPVMRGIYNV